MERSFTIPEIITEKNLPEITELFKDAIAEGETTKSPNVCIRYSTGDSQFYTAQLGEFFFYNGKMYVFDTKPQWAYLHEPDVVKAYFGKELKERGFAHKVAYCGIKTPFKDREGRAIFTGDICYIGKRLNWKDLSNFHVVTSNVYEGYGFAMDNCMLRLEDLHQAPRRVGTIFYKLSFDEMKDTWYARSDISNMYGTNPDINQHLMMGKMTPNFEQDDFVYFVLSSFGKTDWKYTFKRETSYPVFPRPTKRVAPDNIQSLKKNEIFVFGSNKQGHHAGGAARFAAERFGAEWGVGEGLTGQCYALPTMEGKDSFRQAVKIFFDFADQHPELKFLVTAVGCGIAGYTVEQVSVWFSRAIVSPNVYLPASFWKAIKDRHPHNYGL